MTDNVALPKLLRAMASGTDARAAGHNHILEAAAAELEAQRGREPDEPLRAVGISAARCSDPDCRVAHIALINEDDNIIATAVLDETAMAELIAWYRETGGDVGETRQ